MAMVHAAHDPVIEDDGIFEEVDKFEKQGDWTEDRHEILETLSMDEIAAEALRIQAEHPERYLTPEELWKKIRLTEEAQPVERRVEMVGA